YQIVVENAHKAGAEGVGVLVQPMISGVAEAYAGIIDDPRFGPAVCFGLGGIFVEILKDVVMEMAPLSHDEALRMIRRIRALPMLEGARGRERANIDALAALLVGLGQFAVANSGRFRTLDLNPISVGPKSAIAVDIVLEPVGQKSPNIVTRAAE